jgi:hypothetical protein
MSRANPALPDNKAVRSKIVRNRSVNVNNVSAKNRAVAGNKAAEASRADDNPGCLGLGAAGGDSRRFLCCKLEVNRRSSPRVFFHVEAGMISGCSLRSVTGVS